MIGMPHALAFAMGFLSLSQEILWTRVVGVAWGAPPYGFAYVLVLYLMGIAIGARHGQKICDDAARSTDPDIVLRSRSAKVLLLAAIVDVAAPLLYATWSGTLVDPTATSLVILASALLKSVLFPIVHQLGTSSDPARLGRSFSLVYCANILGATGGPLVTGFLLLDHLSTQQCLLLSGAASAALAGWLLAGSAGAAPDSRRRIAVGGSALLAAVCLAGTFAVPEAMYSWSRPRSVHRSGLELPQGPAQMTRLIETAAGVIEAVRDDIRGDIILGGGVYDGRINIDPVVNSNLIDRVLILAALRPKPRRVLFIGLSGGSWIEIARHFPGIESIDVVEINPGYVELVRSYPAVRPLLADPRITIHIDDGRRWLKRNNRSFDLIVMNTSVHWRAFATNVLSREFLEIVRSRMAPGALMTFNSTSSPESVKTSAAMFGWAGYFKGHVYVADAEPKTSPAAIESAMLALQRDGKPVFQPDVAEHRAAVARLAATTLMSAAEFERRAGRPVGIITDSNMLTEYRYRRSVIEQR